MRQIIVTCGRREFIEHGIVRSPGRLPAKIEFSTTARINCLDFRRNATPPADKNRRFSPPDEKTGPPPPEVFEKNTGKMAAGVALHNPGSNVRLWSGNGEGRVKTGRPHPIRA
jgi:hypothetical protein